MGTARHTQACPKRLLKFMYFKNCWSSIVDFWTTAFRQKRILENQHCLYISRSVCWHVSMSVSEHFFSKTTHMVFSEIPLKSDFSEKKKFSLGILLKNTPRNLISWILLNIKSLDVYISLV